MKQLTNNVFMKVGLFIPCYIDQLYPKVAIATLELLEKLGLEVHFPIKQTCCGQPLANSGYSHLTTGIDELFVNNFEKFDYIVSPSGSCALHVKLLVQRVLPFITQHLILIVRNILPSMLDAYTKINNTSYGYGVFIAGPSKTADIEQSLVIGAHGARSLSIFILAESA